MHGEAAESREGECLKGKYQLEELLGAGGMGEVYRATNLGVGRVVAIKLLKPEFADRPSIVERFLREARAANIVRHKNVVEVFDIDTDENGTPFIVQEYLEGEDFSSVLDRFPDGVPPSLALSVLAPIVEAVRAAHERGVVHRDLKPENVFLAQIDGITIPKVLDFGISKLPGTSDADVRLTGTHSIMGSPQYMSPEQILTPQDVDARSDIWSLGVMLFQCLTGRLPFEGQTAEVLFVQICRDEPLSLDDVAPHLPEPIGQVVSRCLEREPSRRFQNAVELSNALKELRKSVRFSESMVGSVGERGPVKPETLIGRDDTRSKLSAKPGTRQGHPGVAAPARSGRPAAEPSGVRSRPGGARTAQEYGEQAEVGHSDAPPAASLETRALSHGPAATRGDTRRPERRASGTPPAATGRTQQGIGQRPTPSGRARAMDADLDEGDDEIPLTLATRSGQTRLGQGASMRPQAKPVAPKRSAAPGKSPRVPSVASGGSNGFDVAAMMPNLLAAGVVIASTQIVPWFTPDGLAGAFDTLGGQFSAVCVVLGVVLGVVSLTVVRLAMRFEAITLYAASAGLLLEGVSVGMLGLAPEGDVGSLPPLAAQVGPLAAVLVAGGFSLYALKRAQEEILADGARGIPYGAFMLALGLAGLLATYRVAGPAMSVML